MAVDSEIEDLGKKITKYPDPFFDLAKMSMPKSIKKLLNYCVFFYYTSEWIYPAVRKLARYPITKLIFKAKEKAVSDKYQNIFERVLKIYSLLFRIGINYFACGNCFLTIRFPFRRNLVCPRCKTSNPIKEFMANPKRFRWANFEFHGECRKKGCKYIGKFTVKDIEVQDEKGIQAILWNAKYIDIEYTEISPKDSIYYYNIPAKERDRIRKGVPVVLETYPWVFIEAVKENKVVELNRDNFYHFKCPTLAEDDMGWGKPHILPAFRKIFYIQTLQRGMEAISWMYIVPLMILFPAPQAGGVDPVKSLNLGKWRAQIEEQIKLWRKDPNHICLMPVPLGSEFIGGNARGLDVTPLIVEAVRHVIGGIGIPYELIYGGLTWSGSNVALRMLENDFLSYREEMLMECIIFLKDQIRIYLKLPDVESVSMKKFKMADDTMQKTALINLANAEKVSDKSLLDEFDMDADTEKKLIGKELDARIDIMTKKVIAQTVAQAMANVEGMKEQTKLQDVVRGIEMARKMKDSGGIENPFDPEKLIAGWTETLSVMDPVKKQEILNNMQTEMPTVYEMIAPQVSEQIKTQGGGGGAAGGGKAGGGKPLPEKNPPRRQETPI